MSVLIIEDEIKTARELKRTIESVNPDATVLDMIQSVKSGTKWLRENPAPDLILADIQLADGLSFEIFRQVEIESPIIFCTAYDQYAIEAFKTSSIDYLLKPVDEDKLGQSIAKYEKMKQLFGTGISDEPQQKIDRLLQHIGNEYKKTLLAHSRENIIPIATLDIAYFQSEFGNVCLFGFNGKKYTMSQTMDEFESWLSPVDFFRVNRQFIINRKAVESLSHYFSRRLLLKLTVTVSDPVIVSKTKSPLFLKWIETN
ncbi:response regulator transcription factor [Flavobacterium sp. SE-s28]|uniref:Response regulator transcription factor n=1 Tax=Flavobacterium silvaticum TaxID=1852020 RepID=A0A972FZT0_9FLAO|nr:response regulator transcription factor [Flavobacterium silvaticum]